MLKPQEWDSVLDNIQSGSTVVCLGAELFTQGGSTIDHQIKHQLENLDHVHLYNDGLFHFRGSADMTSFTRIKQYYQKDFLELNQILEKLASLPIPVFINTNPDLALRKIFQNSGLSHQYSYHHPNKPAAELKEPSVQEPLIYNLLGDIDHRESMVLTHEDLFGFLESIMEGRSISRLLKERINASYNFIFIGLPTILYSSFNNGFRIFRIPESAIVQVDYNESEDEDEDEEYEDEEYEDQESED